MARELALIAALIAAGCDRGGDARPAPASEGEATRGLGAKTAAPPLAHKPFYRIDARPLAACRAGATCEAALVLTALGDYHVNGDYPTKFVGDAAGDVAVEGHAFELHGEKSGTLTVRFKPAKAGPAKLTGTFKLSVCTDENCEIDAPQIVLDIAAS